MDVQPITDQFGSHTLTLTSCSYGSGLSMVDSGHSIKQVCQMGSTCIEYGLGLIIGAVSMRDSYFAERGRMLCESLGSRQFRSYIDNPDKPLGTII